MNVLLVQPPDPIRPVPPVGTAAGHNLLFAPPWNLLCLRTYLQERTRHICTFVDCRTFQDLETELVAAVKAVAEPRILVVNSSCEEIGETVAVLEITKRVFPSIKTVLFGSYPSSHPSQVLSIPRVDFALAGDPEPILRNLLDYLDVEQRLRRIPGLVFQGGQTSESYWLPDLKGLSLADWQGVFWGAYRADLTESVIRAEVRVSRGHSHTPSDRAFGGYQEPLRFWPMDRLATRFQKCAGSGISEVFLTDPPGIWTADRLAAWCSALSQVNNSQPWGLQLLPAHLTEEQARALSSALCRRVVFLVPSCHEDRLKKYGCLVSPRELTATVSLLQDFRIEVEVHFWAGGPEEEKTDIRRVVDIVRALNFCPYRVEPFPFSLDSPLARDLDQKTTFPRLEDWIHWSRDPWTVERPVPLWNGKQGIATLSAELQQIQSAVTRHPKRLFQKLAGRFNARKWIAYLEEKALGLMPSTTPRD